MPTESPRPITRQLLRVALGAPEVPDRDLLARFVSSRDEDAFAEIVRRHGPMVLAACRRVTRRPHDAEDAFQAAFLVLARRAGHLSRPELLANWLYGVAYRTALEARAARRRAEEHVVPAAPEPAAPPPPDDMTELRRIIDEELAKLPDKYRAAVILCDLEGLPRAAAAAQMGIPEGTLSSRLAHARKVLAERLTRRGVTATAGAVGTALSRDARATALPHTLTNKTVHAAVRFVPGGALPPGDSEGGTHHGFPLSPPPVSPAVSSLAEGVLKTMLANRLRQMFAVGLLACGLIGVGTALAQFAAPPTDPSQPPTALDPDTGVPVAAQQPKLAEAKKIGAKGIEDDDVPYGSFPTQAVVRIEEGKLIVRQRAQVVEAVPMKNFDGQTVTVYQRKSGVHASTHDPADVAVFDMKGNRLLPKAWKDLLKNDVHALVAHDGKLPNPRELTLFKQDTLLIVLPVSATPPTPELPGYTPRTTYVPQTTYVPRTYYEPVTTMPAAPPSANVPHQPVPTAPAVAPPAPRPLTPESIPPRYRAAPTQPPPAPGTFVPPPTVPPQNVPQDLLPPVEAPAAPVLPPSSRQS